MQRYSVPSNDPQRTPLTPNNGGANVPNSWGNSDPIKVSSQAKKAQQASPTVASVPQAKRVATPKPKATKKQKSETREVQHDSVLFIRGILNEAIRRGASDVHFEPKTDSFRIRFRIDGTLREFTERPGEDYSTVLNAVKILSDMDIAERILPQDGHLELVLQQVDQNVPVHTPGTEEDATGEQPTEQYYDIRVSVFPSVNGEVIVMRVLNRSSALLSLEQLGMEEDSLRQMQQVLLTSYGMILVTGPTGSGKTTTLYSILQELKSEEKNMMTLEDPIEFHLEWIRQSEIRSEQGFTFDRAMSSILRQDPDVLMIGEIRDPHTAEYAVRSALVGRIVGSTIHANTAIGTIARLIDLGIPRSLIAHSVNAIVAQRLVRKVCADCKEEYQPKALALSHFGLQESKGPFYRGAGCSTCNNSGYDGRAGLYSVMVLDEELRSYIVEQRPLIEIQARAIEKGMRTLKVNAAVMILSGVTTAEEAARSV